ncbi:MAG: histone deacetylase [Bryobacteraceae bacterium]|nr:histone deacetylase [Bryobacteraceae bacterium]
MLPFRLVYHDGYDLNFGAHVFPSTKYKLIRARLLRLGVAVPEDFVEPEPPADEDLLLVHEQGWIERLKNGTLSFQEVLRLEVPYSRQMVNAYWLSAAGTTLAGRLALEHGVGYNIGGGFHHAFPGHGEGFCAIHDVAVAIRRLQKDGLIEKALVIDCDVHHGNGTAAIFAGDASVFTMSIHQFNNYPAEKPPSTIDIHLADGVADAEYLQKLKGPYEMAVSGFRPDLVMYVAGADPYMHDQLGGLSLTLEGLKARDRLVIDTALRYKAPVVISLAGGYAYELMDTVAIHYNTAIAAKESLEETGWKTAGAS